MQSRPLIGLCADHKLINPHHYHCVGDKYLRAVAEAAGAIPIILPALAEQTPAQELLDLLDGIVLTGSYSNLHPRHYDGGEPLAPQLVDDNRDETNLRLIPTAIDAGVPVFAICRGFQEMNVALGGSLHQQVHTQPGFDYHLEDSTANLDTQFGPAHDVHLKPGGILAGLTEQHVQQVNSLHSQGVARLADKVKIEATAGDGLVESFSLPGASAWTLAVQWHPEWKPASNPFYAALWRAFGDACRQRASTKASTL